MASDIDKCYINAVDIEEQFPGIRYVNKQLFSGEQIKTSGIDIPQRHGLYYVPSKLKESLMTLTFFAQSRTSQKALDDTIRQFTTWLYNQSEHEANGIRIMLNADMNDPTVDAATAFATLTNYYHKARYYTCSDFVIMRGEYGYTTTFTIDLMLIDPFKYRVFTPAITASGVTEYSFNISGAERDYVLTIRRWVTELTTVKGWYLNGTFNRWVLQVTNNDVIVIDQKNSVITFNGENAAERYYGTLTPLRPGTNTISFTEGTPNINIVTDERWL